MYHHPDVDDREEFRRFTAMNDMLNPTSVGMLGLRGGERILDVGCGLGQLTRAMARAAGRSGSAVGIVHCESWLREAQRLAEASGEGPAVELRHGDSARLPLRDEEWGTFDVVHGRFVLEQVTNPLEVVAAMTRAVRPGGRIVLEDDDHVMMRLWPEPDRFAALHRSFLNWCEGQGYDPSVGRRLVDLLHRAGAVPKRSASLTVSSCAGSPSFRPLMHIVIDCFENSKNALQAMGAMSAPEFDASMQGLRNWSDHPAAALWYMTCWAEGRRPHN